MKSLWENTTGLCIIHSLTQTQSLSLYYTTLSPYTFWTSGDLDDGDRMKLSSDNYLWSIHIWFKSQNGVFSLGWVYDFLDFVHENGKAPSYLLLDIYQNFIILVEMKNDESKIQTQIKRVCSQCFMSANFPKRVFLIDLVRF